MRIPIGLRLALTSVALASLLAACSGSGSRLTPISRPVGGGVAQQMSILRQAPPGIGLSLSGLLPAVHPWQGPSWINSKLVPEIYVLDYASDTVYIYSTGGVLMGSLGYSSGIMFAAGLHVDNKGNLYVANDGPQNILIFAPGTMTPKLTLGDPHNYPVDVVTDSADNVYVANICRGAPSGSACHPGKAGRGSVYMYKAGQVYPSTSYDNDRIHRPMFIAFDEKHKTLWADGMTTESNGNPIVVSWSKPSHPVISSISIRFPGGMEFDEADNLAIDDQWLPSTLYVFPHAKPPASHSFPLSPVGGETGYDVVTFALNHANNAVWTANCGTGSIYNPGQSDELAYTSGGWMSTISPSTMVCAIAVAPASGK
jgi:DNA-binding beta-propeller fold protein YncE